MNCSSWMVVVLACLLWAGGCAKRVPSPDLTYEVHQKVVLTFRGGEEIEGRIASGKGVELREADGSWKATVSGVTEEQITLSNLVRIRDAKGVRLQAARAADAEYVATPPVPERVFPIADLVQVDRVKIDVVKTARTASFWTYGIVVLSLLVGERS